MFTNKKMTEIYQLSILLVAFSSFKYIDTVSSASLYDLATAFIISSHKTFHLSIINLSSICREICIHNHVKHLSLMFLIHLFLLFFQFTSSVLFRTQILQDGSSRVLQFSLHLSKRSING